MISNSEEKFRKKKMLNKLEFPPHPMLCVLKSEGHLKIKENLGENSTTG